MKTITNKTAFDLDSFIPPFLVMLTTASVLFVALHSAYIVKSDALNDVTRIKTANMHANVYIKKVPETSATLATGALSAKKPIKG